jgi:hypothetical protein
MLKFLDLLCKELDAEDARAELGGRDPDDPRLLWTHLPGGFRLVAVFASPPEDRKAKQERLEHLVSGFSQTLSELPVPPAPSPPVESAFRRLDAALEALRSRAGGVGVVIVDAHSPVLWGTSDAQRPNEDVHELAHVGEALRAALEAGIDLDAICSLQASDVPSRLRDLGVSSELAATLGQALLQRDESALRHHLLGCLAIARVRDEARSAPGARWAHHEPQFGYFVRSFANIYLLLVVFEGAFSELSVESAVVHALPAIEHLVLSLPPLDPEPPASSGGRVIRLRR